MAPSNMRAQLHRRAARSRGDLRVNPDERPVQSLALQLRVPAGASPAQQRQLIANLQASTIQLSTEAEAAMPDTDGGGKQIAAINSWHTRTNSDVASAVLSVRLPAVERLNGAMLVGKLGLPPPLSGLVSAAWITGHRKALVVRVPDTHSPKHVAEAMTKHGVPVVASEEAETADGMPRRTACLVTFKEGVGQPPPDMLILTDTTGRVTECPVHIQPMHLGSLPVATAAQMAPPPARSVHNGGGGAMCGSPPASGQQRQQQQQQQQPAGRAESQQQQQQPAVRAESPRQQQQQRQRQTRRTQPQQAMRTQSPTPTPSSPPSPHAGPAAAAQRSPPPPPQPERDPLPTLRLVTPMAPQRSGLAVSSQARYGTETAAAADGTGAAVSSRLRSDAGLHSLPQQPPAQVNSPDYSGAAAGAAARAASVRAQQPSALMQAAGRTRSRSPLLATPPVPATGSGATAGGEPEPRLARQPYNPVGAADCTGTPPLQASDSPAGSPAASPPVAAPPPPRRPNAVLPLAEPAARAWRAENPAASEPAASPTAGGQTSTDLPTPAEAVAAMRRDGRPQRSAARECAAASAAVMVGQPVDTASPARQKGPSTTERRRRQRAASQEADAGALTYEPPAALQIGTSQKRQLSPSAPSPPPAKASALEDGAGSPTKRGRSGPAQLAAAASTTQQSSIDLGQAPPEGASTVDATT